MYFKHLIKLYLNGHKIWFENNGKITIFVVFIYVLLYVYKPQQTLNT